MAVNSCSTKKAVMWEIGALRRGCTYRCRKRGSRDSMRERREGASVDALRTDEVRLLVALLLRWIRRPVCCSVWLASRRA